MGFDPVANLGRGDEVKIHIQGQRRLNLAARTRQVGADRGVGESGKHPAVNDAVAVHMLGGALNASTRVDPVVDATGFM